MRGRELGELVKQRREQRGLSQGGLSQLILSQTGVWVAPQYIGQIELSKITRPERERIVAIAQALDIPLDQIAEAGDYHIVHETIVAYPHYGHVPGGNFFPEEQTEDYVPIPTAWARGAKRAFLLTVQGNSASPECEDGDMVLVDPERGIEDHSIAVVRIGGEVAIRRPSDIPRDSEVLGVVIGCIKVREL